jgi:tetratricopeptide (TPR) repeat protein
VLAAILVAGAGGWSAWQWYHRPVPPEIPDNISDPVVTETLQGARQQVLDKPRSARAWGRLGMVLHAHELVPEALECYRQAEQLDAADCRWPYYQGVLLKREQPAEAVPAFRRALPIAGKDWMEIQLALADLLLEMDRLAEAEAAYQEVLERQPANLTAHLGLGKAAQARGNWKESLPHLLRAVDGPETKKMAYRLLASVYMRLHQEDLAARAEVRANRLPMDMPREEPLRQQVRDLANGRQARLSESDRYFQRGEAQKSLEVAQELALKYPDDRWVAQAVIRGLAATRDREGARRAIEAALQKWPEAVQIYFFKGQLLYGEADEQAATAGSQAAAIENYRAAGECFEKMTQLRPDDAQAHYNLGLCCKRTHDLAKAEAALRTALRLRPDYAEAHAALAELLMRWGDDGEALVHVRYAIAFWVSEAPGPYVLLSQLLGRSLFWK